LRKRLDPDLDLDPDLNESGSTTLLPRLEIRKNFTSRKTYKNAKLRFLKNGYRL
jgi:hypothetical protein